MNYNPNAVSPTARIVAQRRAYSDIPFAAETATILEEMSRDEPPISTELIRPDLAPRLEARYKLTEKLLRKSGISNVIELAAGFSSRGLMASPDTFYVELDLPEVITQKQIIAEKLLGKDKLLRKANLHFVSGDVLDPASLRAAEGLLPNKRPVAFVCEGLLRYFTMDQKTALAKSIRAILIERGGVWITPDISPRSVGGFVESDALSSHAQNIGKLTGVSFEQNRFETIDEAVSFYESLGFTAESHLFTEVESQLISPHRLDMSRQAVLTAIMPGVAFVLRLAANLPHQY